MTLPRPCSYCGRPYRKQCGCPQALQAKRASQARPGRPGRQARGYDARYEALRRDLALAIHNSRSAGRDVFCCICGSVIHNSWTAEHDPPLSQFTSPDLWTGRLLPAHGACNYARRNTR